MLISYLEPALMIKLRIDFVKDHEEDDMGAALLGHDRANVFLDWLTKKYRCRYTVFRGLEFESESAYTYFLLRLG